jgi:perosamine synthetase
MNTVSDAQALDAPMVLRKLESLLAGAPRPVALHEPVFEGNEWANLKDCLDTGWVSSAGSYVDRFERELGELAGGYAVAVGNGTAALHACLLLAGVAAGDEVLVPALTFIATANAVSYCGALPHFVDSSERTLGVDPERLARHLKEVSELRGGECRNRASGRRIRAVLPMHTFGHPVDMDTLREIADEFHLALVEDAAESLGSYYKGKHTGALGGVGAFSFNGNKIITTGGGGAVVTPDAALAKRAKHLTTTARLPHRWSFVHDEVGYNYRMPNLNAALGCAQLEQLPGLVERKRGLAARYATAFAGAKGMRVFGEPGFAKSNYWLNVLLLDEAAVVKRDEILELTNASGIHTRPVWTLMHRLPMFSACPRMDLAGAESLERRIVCLPSGPRLAN